MMERATRERMLDRLTDTQYLILIYAMPFAVMGLSCLIEARLMSGRSRRHYKFNIKGRKQIK